MATTRKIVIGVMAALAITTAPALANHKDGGGFIQCDYAHNSPHIGLTRDATPGTDWVTTSGTWVGSTSESGAVYAGLFGGSSGAAFVSAGSCNEFTGLNHGGVTEVAVFTSPIGVFAVADGGNDNSGANGYIGVGIGGPSSANNGGPLCAGSGTGTTGPCTPVATPVICEKASSAGGPNQDGSKNWHSTSKDGCDLRL